MSEEIGIVMSLYDKVSPTLKTIGNNTKAFDKNFQELEQSCKSYEKSQESLVKDISTLKSKLVESNQKVKEATKAWKAGKDELSKGIPDRDRGHKVFLWSGNALSFLVGGGRIFGPFARHGAEDWPPGFPEIVLTANLAKCDASGSQSCKNQKYFLTKGEGRKQGISL